MCWDFSWFIVPQDRRPFLTCSSTLSFTPFSFCGLFVIQDPVVVIIPMTRRSFSRLSIKRDLNHSKAWWKIHHMQFIAAQVVDQDLDRVTFPFPVMLKATPIHTHHLGTNISYQVVWNTATLSWLELIISHPMRWRCFNLSKSHPQTYRPYRFSEERQANATAK